MSDVNMARRAELEVCFDGVDITASMRPYLLSLTYTDREEDDADDLVIKLQDSSSIWMKSWLNWAVDASSSPATPEQTAITAVYKVTPAIGLNVRSGPGTSYNKLGALVCGTEIVVEGFNNGWAQITYSGKTAYVSATYIQQVGEATEKTSAASRGMTIQAIISRRNWRGGGGDDVLDTGLFELDSVSCDGPPSTVTIKATGLPFTAAIRQTKKSRAWEEYNLTGIAGELATTNGMTCMYLAKPDPFYQRVEQYQVSDIEFLKQLCHDAGLSLKATNKAIVIFEQADYEAKNAVITVKRGGGLYTKYKLSMSTADTQYASCRVYYDDPATGKCIEGTAYCEDYDSSKDTNQQLVLCRKVGSIGEAQALAEKNLRLHNKFARTVQLTMTGDTRLLAGVNIQMEDWGGWDGKYIITQAKHSVGSSGYTTVINARRVLEGY